jgi:putative transposase
MNEALRKVLKRMH